MESFNINNTKDFMKELLLSERFDDFFLLEAEIVTFNTFTIDGKIKKNFYSSEEAELITDTYSKYSAIKPHLLNIIKGKNTPLSFKIVLIAPQKYYLDNDLNTDIKYVLNIRFENGHIQLISAISRSDFTLDKESDHHWDKEVGILVENLFNAD